MTIATDAPAAAGHPSTSRASLDATVAALQERKAAWTAVSVRERMAILEEIIHDFAAVSGRWAAACIEAEGLDPEKGAAEEVLFGPYFVVRNLRLLRPLKASRMCFFVGLSDR